MNWKPLGIPPGSTPEQAFLLAAQKSNESECILLGWVRGAGWCGCYAVRADDGRDTPAPAIHLMNVGDASILALRRVEKKIVLPGGNGNDNTA